MEEDDDFGDLYTDVLRLQSLPSTNQSPDTSIPSSRASEFNFSVKDNLEDNQIRCSTSDSCTNSEPIKVMHDSHRNSVPSDTNYALAPGTRVPNFSNSVLPVQDQSDEFLADLDVDVNHGVEDDSGAFIPGTETHEEGPNATFNPRDRGEWADESDSEDDLQIVLNDTNHGPMEMERVMGISELDDDNEDEEPLVIVAGEPKEFVDEDWGAGEEAMLTGATEVEKKEAGETAAKVNSMVVPKIGYSNHGYHHQFHSQFKYVRPGASSTPGAAATAPVGVPSQFYPALNMAGRGKNEWRAAGNRNGASLQKSFPGGFGMAAWGQNLTGRAYGGGLEFTLPSHKTIFDVDIDGFEDKPWKYPGADMSDYFNFGLNEESWKEYFQHLENHRTETPIQSKIHVYESGRPEQECDPDLPVELVEAKIDNPFDNSNLQKWDVGSVDATRTRPSFPTGRAIQVEGGNGDRLPSIDIRPPRIRDSGAIIEIVLQDSVDDDSSAGNVVRSSSASEFINGKFREGHLVDEDDMARNGVSHIQSGTTIHCYPDIPRHSPKSLFEEFGHAHEERQVKPSCRMVPSGSEQDDVMNRNNQEGERTSSSREERHCQILSSQSRIMDARECSEGENDAFSNESKRSIGANKDSMMESEMLGNDSFANGHLHQFPRKQKLSSCIVQPAPPDLKAGEEDEGEKDAGAARGNELAKEWSGSNGNFRKWESIGDEVQDGVSTCSGKDRNLQRESDGSCFALKGREDPQLKGYERHARHEDSAGPWPQQREGGLAGRKSKIEDTRKREHGDEVGCRHREKTREMEITEKGDHLRPRKPADNGSYRIQYEKTRHEGADDHHGKRKKDEEYLRRDHADVEEAPHGYREIAGHRRRERDNGSLDPRKRDGYHRTDDHHPPRLREEAWAQRETGGESKREREETHRGKQAYEERTSKRERDAGRDARNGFLTDERAYAAVHPRGRDEPNSSDKEFVLKDAARNSSEQPRRRDRTDDEVSARGKEHDDPFSAAAHGHHQFSYEERRSRHDLSSARLDRPTDAYDKPPHQDNSRKAKESDACENTCGPPKRIRDDHCHLGLKGSSGGQRNEDGMQAVQYQTCKKHREEASSDDEQLSSRRGRSKLERWTSNKERDYSIITKTSSGSYSIGGERDPARKATEPASKEAAAASAAAKQMEDRHLQTVEKLKKRSERFKLPLPSEKDSLAVKRMENESESNANPQVKNERLNRRRKLAG